MCLPNSVLGTLDGAEVARTALTKGCCGAFSLYRSCIKVRGPVEEEGSRASRGLCYLAHGILIRQFQSLDKVGQEKPSGGILTPRVRGLASVQQWEAD